MRRIVADAVSVDQLSHYRTQADAYPSLAWLDFARAPNATSKEKSTWRSQRCAEKKDEMKRTQKSKSTQRASKKGVADRPGAAVKSLDELRSYIRLEGRVVGAKSCMWADDFAMVTIANALRLRILLIDMARYESR